MRYLWWVFLLLTILLFFVVDVLFLGFDAFNASDAVSYKLGSALGIFVRNAVPAALITAVIGLVKHGGGKSEAPKREPSQWKQKAIDTTTWIALSLIIGILVLYGLGIAVGMFVTHF